MAHRHISWTIDLQEGQIKLDSAGFIQVVRKEPMLLGSQVLSKKQRGENSFNRIPFN